MNFQYYKLQYYAGQLSRCPRMHFRNVECSGISLTLIGMTSLILTGHSWKIHSLLKAEMHYYQQHCLITQMFGSYTGVITYLCFLSQILPSLHFSIQFFFEVVILRHELLNSILFEEKCTDMKMSVTLDRAKYKKEKESRKH